MNTLQNSLVAACLLGMPLASTGLAAPQHVRPNLAPGETNWVPQSNSSFLVGLTTIDLTAQTAQDLAEELLGAGVTISNVTFTGANAAGGTFQGGTGIIGFERGVLLSSGNVASVIGPMDVDSGTSTAWGLPGDADLDTLSGVGTNDAAVLEFDFECAASTTVSFQFVFASEEYNEYVFQFNDAFGLLLNGTNIAIVPGTASPVTIDNVNCGDGTLPGVNCGQFINNECDSLPVGSYPCTNIETEMDGLTQVFSAVGTLQPGVNHLKIAVADALDDELDSVVFLRASSLLCANPEPSFDPPTPCGQRLTVQAGTPVSFDIVALATNGLSNQGVSISATGDAAALAGGTFNPSVPTVFAQPASTQFSWTPTEADAGLHVITLRATDQLGQFTECDVPILVTLGQNFCQAVANSTGEPGYLYATGSTQVSNNNLTLVAESVPNGELMYFLGSRGQGFVMNPGGSVGNLCLGGGQAIARLLNTTGVTAGN
ncbi:MAG TPA: choice-of-anchor L domain-containing protein, partial [Planctomycetota bacterium]|nr:choice-of-anchor L domain-containing protein [Planctomycetota bacterium]